MNRWLRLALAILIAFVVWGLVATLVAGILRLVVHIAMLLFFCYMVSELYRLLSREKS